MKDITDHKLYDRSGGFTIVGVVVSLILAASTSVLIAHLIARAQFVASLSRQKFIAVNVAREGLELVRAVRDYNWFSNPDNTLWMDNGLCDLPRFKIDRQIAYAVVNNGQDVEPVTDPAGAKLFVLSTGEWSHTNSGSLTTTPYSNYYSRVMEIDCSTKDGDPPYVTVSSRVRWTDRGENREVVVKERLYNFRYVP